MTLQDNNDSNKENRQVSSNELAPERQPVGLPRLDWRLDPSASFSDWRIVITDEDDEDAAPLGEYNVHKIILAFGERGSEYFARLFKQTDMLEQQEQCVTIPLSKEAAKAFPHLLDFFYQKEIKIEAPELFIHLYPLKDYFQVVERKLDDLISHGISKACQDYDTLILLDKTARELSIDTANDVIFTPMKKSFVQNVLGDRTRRKLLITQHRNDEIRGEELPRLEFLLECFKHLDQELLEADGRDVSSHFGKYSNLFTYIDVCAYWMKNTGGIQFPLERRQLEEAFGEASSGIWQIKNIHPGRAAFLSLAVLYLEGKYCEPQEPQTSLSESQKAAMDHFHRLASMDGMSPHRITSECDQVLEPGLAAILVKDIRVDIAIRLMLPGFTFSAKP